MEIPAAVLTAARREHWIRTHVKAGAERVAIVHHSSVVGFYTPHVARAPWARGRLRIGPLYVAPEWRRLGLASAVYTSLAGPMLACIENGNVASERLHQRAGFAPFRRYSHGWYWSRG